MVLRQTRPGSRRMLVDVQVDSGAAGLSRPEQIVSRLKLTAAPAAFSNTESLFTRFQIKAARLCR
jgi:hypothetical protein